MPRKELATRLPRNPSHPVTGLSSTIGMLAVGLTRAPKAIFETYSKLGLRNETGPYMKVQSGAS